MATGRCGIRSCSNHGANACAPVRRFGGALSRSGGYGVTLPCMRVAVVFRLFFVDDSRTRLDALASLADPTRRALYEYVRQEHRPVGREAAASAIGISRSLAAYHLDRLVEAGFLRVHFARPAGRSGPGAGRPAKLYELSGAAVQVSFPPRDYKLAARVFAAVLAGQPDESVRDALQHAARQLGKSMVGRQAAPAGGGRLLSSFQAVGYEPYLEGDAMRLGNCLFADLVRDQRGLTCSMNLSLIEGALEALGDYDHEARLDPGEGRCCVAIVPRVRRAPRSPGTP